MKLNKYKRKVIDCFDGEYRWLSNFYPIEILHKIHNFDENVYPSVEHAYQASKTLDEQFHFLMIELTAGQVKRFYRKESLTDQIRSDWDDVKDQIMYELVLQKFKYNCELKTKLLATGDALIIEGNTWGDTYWGQCKGVGQNKLGEILMKVRYEIV